jgi:uncharacterized RDD family membrane protein YckC
MNNNEKEINTNNLELASSKKRLYSFVIDDLLVTIIAMLILWTPIQNTQGNYDAVISVMNTAFLQIVFVKVAYQTFFIWYYGATLGKMLVKIRVIDFNHFGKITFVQSLLRALTRIASEAIFYIGFILSFYTESKQTLHDKFAKTLVVND